MTYCRGHMTTSLQTRWHGMCRLFHNLIKISNEISKWNLVGWDFYNVNVIPLEQASLWGATQDIIHPLTHTFSSYIFSHTHIFSFCTNMFSTYTYVAPSYSIYTCIFWTYMCVREEYVCVCVCTSHWNMTHIQNTSIKWLQAAKSKGLRKIPKMLLLFCDKLWWKSCYRYVACDSF